jgi:hypothetical protein
LHPSARGNERPMVKRLIELLLLKKLWDRFRRPKRA